MENPHRLTTLENIVKLRAGIKQRYQSYHLLDRDRFPQFGHNTNRVNYEPLRASFEEEFYVVRGLDRINQTIHIPSTNTLALLFTDDSYVPSQKIWNTCWLYAGESTQRNVPFLTNPTDLVRPIRPGRILPIDGIRLYVVWGSLLLIIVIGLGYQLSSRTVPTKIKRKASNLLISQPSQNKIVSREIVVEGKVSNADTVWVLVGSKTGGYWAQRPIVVNDDGTWKGPILIGHFTNLDTGVRFQLKAMVHPVKPLKEEDYFRPWPKAELMSETVEVIKKVPSVQRQIKMAK